MEKVLKQSKRIEDKHRKKKKSPDKVTDIGRPRRYIVWITGTPKRENQRKKTGQNKH